MTYMKVPKIQYSPWGILENQYSPWGILVFGTFFQTPNECAQRVENNVLSKSPLANKSHFMKKIDLLVKKVEKQAF